MIDRRDRKQREFAAVNVAKVKIADPVWVDGHSVLLADVPQIVVHVLILLSNKRTVDLIWKGGVPCARIAGPHPELIEIAEEIFEDDVVSPVTRIDNPFLTELKTRFAEILREGPKVEYKKCR